jgi:DNA-binding NtrC family response regulator
MAKILIVDDEPQLRDMLRQMLQQDSHEVLEAENGIQGCQLYREHKPDIIISDLVMPEQNGIDMLLELKKEFSDLRVLAISGGGGITGSFDYLPIAKLIGAVQILKKPFGLQELREAVELTIAA